MNDIQNMFDEYRRLSSERRQMLHSLNKINTDLANALKQACDIVTSSGGEYTNDIPIREIVDINNAKLAISNDLANNRNHISNLLSKSTDLKTNSHVGICAYYTQKIDEIRDQIKQLTNKLKKVESGDLSSFMTRMGL